MGPINAFGLRFGTSNFQSVTDFLHLIFCFMFRQVYVSYFICLHLDMGNPWASLGYVRGMGHCLCEGST